jgi:hypothetical protein
MPAVSREIIPDMCAISPVEYATYPKLKIRRVSLIEDTVKNLMLFKK